MGLPKGKQPGLTVTCFIVPEGVKTEGFQQELKPLTEIKMDDAPDFLGFSKTSTIMPSFVGGVLPNIA